MVGDRGEKHPEGAFPQSEIKEIAKKLSRAVSYETPVLHSSNTLADYEAVGLGVTKSEDGAFWRIETTHSGYTSCIYLQAHPPI